MSKKFVLFNNFGCEIPDILKPLIDKYPYPECRCSEELISFIESVAKDNILPNFSTYFERNKDVIARCDNYKGADWFFAYSSDKKFVTHFSIISLDDTKNYSIVRENNTEVLQEV